MWKHYFLKVQYNQTLEPCHMLVISLEPMYVGMQQTLKTIVEEKQKCVH